MQISRGPDHSAYSLMGQSRVYWLIPKMSQENIFWKYCKDLPMRLIDFWNLENAKNFLLLSCIAYIYPHNNSKLVSQICSPSVKGPLVRFQSVLKGERRFGFPDKVHFHLIVE